MSDDTGTLPLPGDVIVTIGVDGRDGERCRRFTPGGPVEVWLVASERPRDTAGREGLKIVTLPLAFPNYKIAKAHAAAIATAAKLLETAIADAIGHADDTIPARDDGHQHVVRFERFSRTLPFQATCEVCMQTLVEDVRQWAIHRGLLNVGNDRVEDVERREGTIKAAIEKAFNRDGGLANA